MRSGPYGQTAGALAGRRTDSAHWARTSSPFNSFWLGGFESSTHINRAGTRLDLIAATQHDLHAEADYRSLRGMGMASARDAVRWHLLEREGRIDLAPLLPRVTAARRAGVQVIWDLCHYGWPSDVDPFSASFVWRFARFAREVALLLAQESPAPRLYTPVNEISFLAWAAGQVAYVHPFGVERGAILKRQLVQAFIAACDAIREVDPAARFLTAEPLIHLVPPRGLPYYGPAAERERNAQFEAWDMLVGRLAPQLGGAERYLDVLGVNFYHGNQWEHPGGRRLGWDERPLDPRWRPLRYLLEEVWHRYGRPLYVSETSHFGAGRAAWLRHVCSEVEAALAMGVPVWGVCLYPVLDRPDWDDPDHWHNSGLWDLVDDGTGVLTRALNSEYAVELKRAQARLEAGASQAPALPLSEARWDPSPPRADAAYEPPRSCRPAPR